MTFTRQFCGPHCQRYVCTSSSGCCKCAVKHFCGTRKVGTACAGALSVGAGAWGGGRVCGTGREEGRVVQLEVGAGSDFHCQILNPLLDGEQPDTWLFESLLAK